MQTPFPILSPEPASTASAVVQIREQIDQLLEIIAQQEEDLREAKIMLNRANTEVILYGKQPPPDHSANLGSLCDSDTFIVVAIELKDRGQLFGRDSQGHFSAREVELMKTAIYNVFETVLGPLSIASCCESDLCFANILVTLLDEEQPEELMSAGIQDALDTATDIIYKNYNIDLVAAKSNIVHGYTALPQARLAAYNILQRKLPMEEIAHVWQVPSPETVVVGAIPQTNTHMEKQLYQFILSRNLEMAQLTLRELVNSDLSCPDIPFSVAKLRFLNHAESLMAISGIPTSDVSALYLTPLVTPDALYTLMDELFSVIAARQQENPEKMQREKIEKVAAYIETHYNDVNLCLAKLCDLFQMNQSYLSRMFKSICSVGILDYIHTQRLIHVKEMLKDPNNSIDTIWAAVGYTNRRTFNRTFRKFEGMSASEYRSTVIGRGKPES